MLHRTVYLQYKIDQKMNAGKLTNSGKRWTKMEK